jgi:hypothetical protein
VPALMAAILAPAIRALDGSVTRPVSEALVDCARRTGVTGTKRRSARVKGRRIIQHSQLGGIFRRMRKTPLGCHPEEP